MTSAPGRVVLPNPPSGWAVLYPGNPSVVYPIPQEAGQIIYQPVMSQPLQYVACYANSYMAASLPGWMMHNNNSLPPPPGGRPGQFVQYADGSVYWLPPKPATY
jgi:hypothetical protein